MSEHETMNDEPEAESDLVKTLVWVGLYLNDRTWGGPEEGGWWYDCGVLVTDHAVYAEIGVMPSCHMTLAAALSACAAVEDAIEKAELNRGRRSTSSVLSTGRYEAMWWDEATLPARCPAVRPHYE